MTVTQIVLFMVGVALYNVIVGLIKMAIRRKRREKSGYLRLPDPPNLNCRCAYPVELGIDRNGMYDAGFEGVRKVQPSQTEINAAARVLCRAVLDAELACHHTEKCPSSIGSMECTCGTLMALNRIGKQIQENPIAAGWFNHPPRCAFTGKTITDKGAPAPTTHGAAKKEAVNGQ